MNYDLSEAKRVAADTPIGSRAEHVFDEDRTTAARALLKSLVQLNDVIPTFRVTQSSPYMVVFQFGQSDSVQVYERTGRIFVGPPNRGEKETLIAGLRYDALGKAIVSTEVAQDVVPEPGKPFPRRDPTAVVMEFVVRALRATI